jgi:SAM domain (Sterile alpha motif)
MNRAARPATEIPAAQLLHHVQGHDRWGYQRGADWWPENCPSDSPSDQRRLFYKDAVDIAAWLSGLGLERYVEVFEANDIDAAVLRTLNADDLRELGVTSLGHRKKLLEAIASFADQFDGSSGPVRRGIETELPELRQRKARGRPRLTALCPLARVEIAGDKGATRHCPSSSWQERSLAPQPSVSTLVRSAVHFDSGTSSRLRITCHRIDGSESRSQAIAEPESVMRASLSTGRVDGSRTVASPAVSARPWRKEEGLGVVSAHVVQG